jgi:hypothetical protein
MTQATIRFFNIPSGPNRHFHTYVPTPTALKPALLTTGSGDLSVANPGIEYLPPGPTPHWRFVFWSWGTNSTTDLNATLPTVPAGANATFTSWYRPWPGGGGPGEYEVGMETWAFSETAGGFITEVPIQAVSPASAWVGGPNDAMPVTKDGAIDITAKGSIGSEEFKRWVVAPLDTSPSYETSSLTVHGAKGLDALCIAFYGPKSGGGSGPFRPIDPGRWDPERPGRPWDWVADPVPFDLIRLRRLEEEFLRRRQALEQEFQRSGQRIATEISSAGDELSEVLSKAASMAGHEVQSWLGDIRARLSRLAEAEKLLEERMRQGSKK